MKKLLANLMIALGTVVALVGVMDTPLVQDQLPISLMSPGSDQISHQIFRAVLAESQSPDYLPYVLLLLGLTVLIVGIAFRRKLRSIAA